ncbi:MAG: aminopeptidase N, partial [Pseudobdellovibrionaceae bacterium]
MKESAPQVFRLEDYKTPPYTAKQVELFFDVRESHTQVTSKVKYEKWGSENSGSLELNGDFFELVSMELETSAGKKSLSAQDYKIENHLLTLTALPAEFTLTTVTKFDPKQNTALEGLYQSGDLLVSQNEAQGFRRITYFLDRPDVMAVYTTTIEADEKRYPILLSNGNCVERKKVAGGRHQVKFVDPFPKPCYLFCVVAGDLG